MKPVDSIYYPPRARKVGRIPNWLYRLRRALQLERLALRSPVPSRPRLALWVLIPGTLALARGQRWPGSALITVWLAMLAAYWIWIGTAWSTWAFVCASAIHTLSATLTFAAFLTHLPRNSRVRRASLYGFLVVLVLYVLSPLGLTRRVVLPVQTQGRTVLINTAEPISKLHRGDWIAYRIYTVNGAAGFDRILALPGETIRFHADAFEVGGTAYQRVSEQMPTQGEMSMPKGEYFVWPAGAHYAYGGAGEAELPRGIARVPEGRVIGPAYHRWFWRKQALAPLVALKDWTPPSLHP